ncbi:hypothetical protein DV735_g564, partial [Chaetothyriales sp. CBS 134920]
MVLQTPLIRLQCGCNSYDWGKIGSSSAAAQYAAATPSSFSIQEDKPYAELWMGTHHNLPSKDVTTGRSLLDLVSENPALMGHEITAKYQSKLPFLLKVLSINKPLSIQAHPNKKMAEILHAKDPKNYPDDNHKPEMTIAITAFEGLCGFRPLPEIVHFLNTVPPLRDLVGEEAAKNLEAVASSTSDSDTKPALQAAFSHLMKSDKAAVAAKAAELVALASENKITASASASKEENDRLNKVVTRANSHFPNDIGLFNLLFLNIVRMNPGQAIHLKADDIHAYISGDIVECMASSDNVIRAGFTPKFQDVDTLVDILTYDHNPPEEQLLQPTEYPFAKLNSTAYSSGSSALLYDPPIEEFSIISTTLKARGAKATFEPLAGPSIVLTTSGSSGTISVGPKTEEIKQGWIYFVGATAELVIENTGDDD